MSKITIAALCILMMVSCDKTFLEEKPNSGIVLANNMEDIMGILENSYIMNLTCGLAQISADEYEIPNDADYNALPDITARNAYVWKEDLFQGVQGSNDWNQLYRTVFYANSVLDQLQIVTDGDSDQKNLATGWAKFARAYAMHELAINFCEFFDDAIADIQIGVPVRTDPAVDYTVKRGTLRDVYDQIFLDLRQALPLLPDRVSATKTNQPSKAAVYALLARIHLNRAEYSEAELFADSAMLLHEHLTDFNSVSTSTVTPFNVRTNEIIYYSAQIQVSERLTGASSVTRPYAIVDSLLGLYDNEDLRFQIYFRLNNLGVYNSKRRYTELSSPFSGLATDEVILIKAECAARRGENVVAKNALDQLLEKRYKTGTYTPITEVDSELISKVLLERRKELVWRGLRWHDLKRLNKEGASVYLSRTVGSQSYVLPPNSRRYIFPIPYDEIEMSGIDQNDRRGDD